MFVDDTSKPRSGLVVNPEGFFIAGSPENRAFNEQLCTYMEDTIRKSAPVRDTDDLWFYIDDPDWEKHFPEIFSSRPPFKVGRLHYSIRLPVSDWSNRLPEGYKIHRADTNLNYAALIFPEDIWEWVESDVDDYLERGFGAIMTHRDKIVSWCTADCAACNHCEIGIITTSSLRRKGLGSLTVNTALNFCNKSGFQEVDWHCEEHNYGSIATAEKVGFEKKTEYYAWVCMRDPEEHIKGREKAKKLYA